MREIDGLRAALEALPLRIDEVSSMYTEAPVASYPGGARPSSIVMLHGGGLRGSGEHVGWSAGVHAAFERNAAGIRRGQHRLGQWAASLEGLPPHDRAALEAAAVDLALRQQHSNLFRLAGLPAARVRYVVSFARADDPLAEAMARLPDDVELKIDADPAWPDSVYHRLAVEGRVAVLDFKMGGEVDDHERASAGLPDAWIEDPKPGASAWSPALLARLSTDAAVTSTSALDTLIPRPAAVNVKPARMGSVLDAIDCLAHCRRIGVSTYLGGMFEVGVGRMQLRALAAIACPDGPNDIAPLVGDSPRTTRLEADADAIGFGASHRE